MSVQYHWTHSQQQYNSRLSKVYLIHISSSQGRHITAFLYLEIPDSMLALCLGHFKQWNHQHKIQRAKNMEANRSQNDICKSWSKKTHGLVQPPLGKWAIRQLELFAALRLSAKDWGRFLPGYFGERLWLLLRKGTPGRSKVLKWDVKISVSYVLCFKCLISFQLE